MPKSKSKNNEPPRQLAEETEDLSGQEPEDGIEEWMAKYTGENHMTWFLGILKTHANKAVRELLPQFEGQFNEKRSRQEDIKKELEDLQSENKKLHSSVEKLQYQLHKKEERINELVLKKDNIEQKDFINDVQMVGLEESVSE